MLQKYLILDTDVGSDCDDMLAISYLIYATKKLNLNLSAITYSHTCPHAIPAIKALFRSLNADEPLIGRMDCEWNEMENYSKKVAEKFSSETDYGEVPSAVKVLREALAKNEKSTICAIGPLTNIARLLESKADEVSPLNGVELMRGKCEKLVVMGGQFIDDTVGARSPEWNFKIDALATKTTVETCPVPIIFSPFELGVKVLTGGKIMDKYGESTPLSLSFLKFGDTKELGGRFSWDPITAVYAVEGAREWLEESSCGEVLINETGASYFIEKGNGLHRVLKFNSKREESEIIAELSDYIDDCVIEIFEG